MARLCRTRLNRATSAYSSACQSCDSICVVSGFQVRPRCSTNDRETSGQSAPGTATTCAPYVPVAPLSLPRYSSAAIRVQLAVQPVREDGELLAERRRRGGLAVRAGEHRLVGLVARERGDLVGERLRGGQPDLVDRAAHHERVGEVVDVLAGAGEVDELADVVAARSRPGVREPLLEEVLDRLDVVHGDALDLGRARRPRPARTSRRRRAGRRPSSSVSVGAPGTTPSVVEVDQPLDLDVHALAVQRGLAQVVDERRDRRAVAAVQRTERDRRA